MTLLIRDRRYSEYTLIKMSQNKCEYFNKGYCKQTDKCTKTHPIKECDGDCNDKKTCPKRHRVPCKNLKKCDFYASKSCEFLHVEHIREETIIDGVDIKDTINTIKILSRQWRKIFFH